MSIDIDGLSYDELLDLNDRLIARLKHLDAADAIDAMMKLSLGSKVCFDAGKRGVQVGTLIKFNQKTVSVLTEDGRCWKALRSSYRPLLTKLAAKPTSLISRKRNNLVLQTVNNCLE